MLDNIASRESLHSLARKKSKPFDIKAAHPADKEKLISEGWEFVKKLKASVQLRKKKSHSLLLEDRVWALFYKMNFLFLSGHGGAKLTFVSKSSTTLKSQIDVVAIDNEVAIAIECKSSVEYKKRPQFQEELGKFVQIKEQFTKSVRSQFSNGKKLQCVFLMVLSKVVLTEQDRERARAAGMIIFDENDISYYEHLANHLGPAAKYQVFADMLPGKEISGLSIKIPAIKTRMGGYTCHAFSISPEYLLKISYVSHRSKGKASDISTYQRMLAKARLKKIRDFISDDGIFPTNIILNFDKGRLLFEKIKQEHENSDDLEVGVLGWLSIKPAFKSAWIIDGQHRLFAYSGHEKSSKSKVVVLAFEGLRPSKQAELFVDINAKQKSVKQSLLYELYAELHWDSDDITDRISAIISKSIQDLNSDPDCCLYQRIQTSDGEKNQIKCITLTTLSSQIEKRGFYILKEKAGSVVEYGPLWGGDDNLLTLKRTNFVLKSWLNTISKLNASWWEIGSGDGGGLSMNDGVASMIAVLRSVFEVLDKQGYKLVNKSDKELVTLIMPYASALGNYLHAFDEAQRKAFRDLRGVAGVTFRTRQAQNGIRREIKNFDPEGLEQWLEEQKLETNKRTKEFIDAIERLLQQEVIDMLKEEFAGDEELWWYEGVPAGVRSKTNVKIEEDKNRRGGKEFYFDLIDYKRIIHDNWTLFESRFGFGKGGKEKKLEWFDFINEIRKIVSHPSSAKVVKLEELSKIQEYHEWLISEDKDDAEC